MPNIVLAKIIRLQPSVLELRKGPEVRSRDNRSGPLFVAPWFQKHHYPGQGASLMARS
jgi:hypothetical protein